MSILLNVSETGFLQLLQGTTKLDMEINDLKYKLSELETRRNEFWSAIQELKPFFRPNPEIIESNGEFHAIVKFERPMADHIEVKVGKIKDFKGIDDPKIRETAIKMVTNIIREKYPNYF